MRRQNEEKTIIIVAVILLIIGIAVLFWIDDYQGDICRDKGGEWHGGRNSICIKPDSEII